MINLQFNSLCPFCNNHLTITNNENYYSHRCEHCVTLLLYCKETNLNKLYFYNNQNKNTYYLIFDINQFIIRKPETQIFPIPNFSSLQDLIDIANTLILFQ